MMINSKTTFHKKLSSFIAPPAILTKEERIAVLSKFAVVCLRLFKQYQSSFALLPFSSVQRLTELQKKHFHASNINTEIFQRIRKSGLIGQYLFLAALLAPRIHINEPQKYNDWLALILLSCLQLSMLEKHDSAIKDALRQIRLIATQTHHSNLLNKLPCISNFHSIKELLIQLDQLRLKLKEESQFDQRHFKGLCFLQIAIRDATTLAKGITRARKTTVKRNTKVKLQTDGKSEQLSELKTIIESATNQEQDEAIDVRKTKTIRNNATSTPHQSLALKAQRTKNIAKQLERRQLSLPCDPNELTEHDVEHLARFCIKRMSDNEDNEDTAGWLLLSLLTGRTAVFLFERNLRDKIFYTKQGNPYLRLTHKVPASKQPKELKKILPDTTPHIFIPLPLGLAQWIAKKHNSPDNEEIDSYLRKLNRTHRVRLTPNKIAGYLEHFMLNQGVDDMVISLLRNEDHLAKPSLSYGSITLHSPISCHSEFSKHIFELAEIELKLSPDLLGTNEYTGSKLFVDESVCQSLFKLLANNINNNKNCWDFHNQYLIYVWSLLSFSTGHRDVDAPFGKLSDYNPDNGSLWISDKECRSSLSARTLILPKTAKQQISFFINHLKELIKLAKFAEPEIEKRCIDALNGKKNLLFAIVPINNKLQAIDLTPSVIDKLFSFPFQHNWPRHYFRSLFCKINISSELANAWMGHVIHGNESFSQFSALSISDLKQISTIIESKLNILQVEALQGWKTR